MYTMKIYLPKRLKRWAIKEARRRGFPDVSAYVDDLARKEQSAAKGLSDVPDK